MVLLLEDECDDIAGVGSLILMDNGLSRSSRWENVWATHYEGRVVLDESIWTTRNYFEFGGVCGKSGEKAEHGGEGEEFREHD